MLCNYTGENGVEFTFKMHKKLSHLIKCDILEYKDSILQKE